MNLFYFFIGFLVQVSVAQCTDRASKAIPGASITYKKTIACGSVVSYSGFVRMSSTVVPGGPCIAQKGGNSVIPNPFPFNRNAHVLYVDQPNQVGFSYDEIVAGVFDALGGLAGSGKVIPGGVGSNLTNIQGRFASQNPATTAKTSKMAAKSMWYFLQVFFADFDINHGDKYSVSIWGNSYGGMSVATLASYILRTNSKLPVKAGATYKAIRVPSGGITNGCMDIEAQGAAYATLPYNNTWNNLNGTAFQLYTKEKSDSILSSARSPGGCFEQVQACRKLKASNDPNDEGNDETANTACATASAVCSHDLLEPYSDAGRSQYDMGLNPADPNPPKYAATYLNKPSTRKSLGVPTGLNYTLFSSSVFYNFNGVTGDPMRKGSDDLTYLLNRGTRVAMIYGDRDWRCNWLGAENLTLSLPWPTPGTPHLATSSYIPSTSFPSPSPHPPPPTPRPQPANTPSSPSRASSTPATPRAGTNPPRCKPSSTG
ncbi:hypothetical protein PMIN03_006467 [Paraphaeosphaeria minitans]